MYQYYALFKPYGMLSQFTREGENSSLAELGFNFPVDVYPVGRLDADSEGLLLLTNDKRINSRLLLPSNNHTRTYLVQVEGEITQEALGMIENGIVLNEKGRTYKTLPSKAKFIQFNEIPERNPPVRFRKNIPTSWLELKLIEGKNRQVRKMTAAVGFPTLRLIRTEIENIRLESMEKGWVKEIKKNDFYRDLNIKM